MEIIIRPKTKWWRLDLRELWMYRDLSYFLSWKDLKVRYKQTSIGALWAVFQPLFSMIVFTVFFGRLAKIPSDNIPYPIFVYCGLLFWLLFSNSLSSSAESFVGNERLITKVYFPRLLLPLSTITTNFLDFLIASGILVIMMFYYRYAPSLLGILMVPFLLLLTVAATLGIGLFIGSLNVKYRDVRFALPFFIQLLIFITPVIYPASIVSPKHQWILGLNPMAGVIDTARAVLLSSTPIHWGLLGVSVLCTMIYCFLGYFYFQKVEKYFADII